MGPFSLFSMQPIMKVMCHKWVRFVFFKNVHEWGFQMNCDLLTGSWNKQHRTKSSLNKLQGMWQKWRGFFSHIHTSRAVSEQWKEDSLFLLCLSLASSMNVFVGPFHTYLKPKGFIFHLYLENQNVTKKWGGGQITENDFHRFTLIFAYW